MTKSVFREENAVNDKVKEITCDVTVAGGGIAGICAAVAAAREGCRVVLINDRSVLGGNASSEIGITMNGASHLGLNTSIYAREGGLPEEIRLRMAAYTKGGGYDTFALLDAVYFDMIYEEKNIVLLLNTGVYDCETEHGRIVRCLARHEISNVIYRIESPVYIDATGNGTLAFTAGCSYRMGREGIEEYQERNAPPVPDSYTMGNTFYFETMDCGHEVIYTPPAFAKKPEEMEFLKDIHKPGNHRGLSVKGAHWSFEYGGQMDVVYDSEEIDLELRRLVYGIWDYIKNSGNYPEAKNYALKRVYARSGARESRRFLGGYVLSQNDIEEKRDFEDAVCTGGWPMDVHAPLGIYDSAPATEFIPVTGVYQIPFRCLYSSEIENLMFAGRNVSVTHIALGSVRVMATCGCMGQAVGTAAALCRELSVDPGELGKEHIGLLRRRLDERDQTIKGYRGNGTAMEYFRASADTERCFENKKVDQCRRLDRDLALALMLETPHLDSLKLWVENDSEEETVLKYRILEGDHMETFLPERIQKQMQQPVQPGFRGWLRLEPGAKRGADGKVYLSLSANESLAVGMCRERLIGAVTLRMYTEGNCQECNHDSVPLHPESGYRYLDHRYNKDENLSFCDLVPAQRVYAPSMALSPYSRPYGKPNLWLGEGEYPRTLTLNAVGPAAGRILTVTFDTDLTIEPIRELPGCLARDADIRILYGDGEEVTEKIRDNWRRQIRLSVRHKEIREIRITILRSWGGEAGIYGVNLY